MSRILLLFLLFSVDGVIKRFVLLSEGSRPKVRIFNHRVLLCHRCHSCRPFFFVFWIRVIISEAVKPCVGSFWFIILPSDACFRQTASEAHVTGGLRLCKCSQKEGAACVLMDLVCSQACSEHTLYKVQAMG